MNRITTNAIILVGLFSRIGMDLGIALFGLTPASQTHIYIVLCEL